MERRRKPEGGDNSLRKQLSISWRPQGQPQLFVHFPQGGWGVGDKRLCSPSEKLTAERQPHPAPAAAWGNGSEWGPRYKEAPPH